VPAKITGYFGKTGLPPLALSGGVDIGCFKPATSATPSFFHCELFRLSGTFQLVERAGFPRQRPAPTATRALQGHRPSGQRPSTGLDQSFIKQARRFPRAPVSTDATTLAWF
jgi:hypothetical protein